MSAEQHQIDGKAKIVDKSYENSSSSFESEEEKQEDNSFTFKSNHSRVKSQLYSIKDSRKLNTSPENNSNQTIRITRETPDPTRNNTVTPPLSLSNLGRDSDFDLSLQLKPKNGNYDSSSDSNDDNHKGTYKSNLDDTHQSVGENSENR